MNGAELRARLRAGTDAPVEDGSDLLTAPPIPAAVLVPIVLAPTPAVLLTKRTAHLTAHAGQVSFPGGRIDPGDASAEAAALREATEEIGLPANAVELVGRLPEHITGTGFQLVPVIGLIAALPPLRLSPHEVEATFLLPLSVLLDPTAPQRQRAQFRGQWRHFWVWPHDTHHIWGATAAILLQLARRLRG